MKAGSASFRNLSVITAFIIVSGLGVVVPEATLFPKVPREAEPSSPSPPAVDLGSLRRQPLAIGGATSRVVCPGVSKNSPQAGSVASFSVEPYRGLGAWVDLYDYAIRECADPVGIADLIAGWGVETLYVQTGLWKNPEDPVWPEALDAFLARSHSYGVQVVGWYVPGFGDIERDVNRSLTILSYRSKSGHAFDGFAADLEARDEVGGNRTRFNNGVAEYSRRLREAAGPDLILGAIVPDAKNNERATARWGGFPWPEIAANYQVVLPMTYWTVTKGSQPDCLGERIETEAYIAEVKTKTFELMGAERAMHYIAGIADCATVDEVAGYVSASGAAGALGRSIYDLMTMVDNPAREQLLSELSRPGT